ncbi:MAG TPA: hypothetical protein ENH82_17485 [bacterium]|nr:hypothetical protein [bacterium]
MNPSKHPLYSVWRNIKQRCSNPNIPGYKYYGGKGIKVCEEWLNNPKAFIEWALANGYKKGLDIDRIDNNGDYKPNNCQFISHAKNSRKRKCVKLNWQQVEEIRCAKLAIPKITHREIAQFYNVGIDAIGQILSNRCWTKED